MTRRGCYHLIIRLRRGAKLAVGRLGLHDMPAGWYVYTGSARSGLAARIARHRREEKRLHWHIDYLLASPGAEIVDAVEHPGEAAAECSLNKAIWRLPGARVVVPEFGSSDCRSGCPAHLYYFRRRPEVT